MRQGYLIPAMLFQEQSKELVLEDRQYNQNGKECPGQNTDPFQVMLDDAVIRLKLGDFHRRGRELAGSLSLGFFTHGYS